MVARLQMRVFTELKANEIKLIVIFAMCYPVELSGSQNSCQLNMRRIRIVCNNEYAISTILLLYYIYVFIFIYLYL